MLWVTKKKMRIARAATAWLIRRFIDEQATFRFVADGEVRQLQEREGAIGFHATGASYPALNGQGLTAFEALVEEYRPTDCVLRAMGRIVHDADTGARAPSAAPEAAGLRAVSVCLPEVCGADADIIVQSRVIYDCLYYVLTKQHRPEAGSPSSGISAPVSNR